MSRSPLAMLFAALASTAALAVPSVAAADLLPPKVEGDVLTVEADDTPILTDDDTVVISVVGGELAVDGTPTGLAANAAASIVVEAGEGSDIVDASALAAAEYGEMFLHGDEGNDVLAGGAGPDELTGDLDDDRLIGLGGFDEIRGGEGDDAMVWNAGDGPELQFGEGGSDESEINGSPIARDVIAYAPLVFSTEGVQIVVQNSIDATIEATAERLTIDGLGGPDRIQLADEEQTVSDRTRLTLIGGGERDILLGDAGPDVAIGGTDSDDIALRGGDDTLSGGVGDDILFGEEGDDRLVGEGGADLLIGNSGDDRFAWSNGDGSDELDGDTGFDRAELSGAATAADALSLVVVNGTTTLRRTNLTQFELALVNTGLGNQEPHGGIEAVAVDGLGGDDTFTVTGDLAGLAVAAQGGPGDDALSGGFEEDSLLGGPGADTIDPGSGSDLIDGQEGDDSLFSRDGFSDLVRGGEGEDTAQTDAASVDAVDAVEDLDRPADPKQPGKPQDAVGPPAADTRALLPQLGKVSVRPTFDRPILLAPLACPVAETGGCATTLTLQTAAPVRLGRIRAPLVLGSKATPLAAGQQATATVKLVAGTDELARAGRLRVRLRLDSSDAAGNSATTTTVLRLRVPAPLRERP